MEFSPANPVIKLCLQGMNMEDNGKPEEALTIFLQAFNEVTDDFEKFTAAHYVVRHQNTVVDKLRWLQTALQYALKVNDDAVNSAFPALYQHIARCYEQLGDADNAKKNNDLSASFAANPSDKGPFYHGTRADLQVGDMLTAGRLSNYHADVIMNHIYFTAMVNGAGFAAALAKGEGHERVYIVEPKGSYENDPNVTDKKFPGNPTRSYRTREPMKIIGEVTEWVRLSPEALQQFREKLANTKGEIIN
ncbi:NAD(+)--rifampin ADP-ribosyltransferase [Flavipsychrobacter stenotrophus]|uniref:NAD(+)--rifampin ADP-ribosyltransferase n=1 Tax=Flavipsychrobacter stenotrophus TaxID=2077091 RepID=A0A2S7T136_9BACT|nr:NAD(+)--rifampin ADP-ribosyltransferase [Flavipsychrobacter stenotrophus]PQJ12567.1 NAD(+)--rifampin ADP-ribosyltransferase [Flavipsychrobacter stenotrophus]